MQTLPRSRNDSGTGGAALVSGVVHLVLVAVLLRGSSVIRYFDDSRILPALYLYAQDRHPAEPREIRLPIPEPTGNGSHFVAPVSLQPLEHGERPRTMRIPGLVPSGLPSAVFDSVFSVLSVDSEVVRLEGSAAPVYPEALLSHGIEGSVEAEFVVDTTGLVDPTSVHIRRSSRAEFAAAVRLALMGMEFRPAWRGARRVRQLVSQRFTFHVAAPGIRHDALKRSAFRAVCDQGRGRATDTVALGASRSLGSRHHRRR